MVRTLHKVVPTSLKLQHLHILWELMSEHPQAVTYAELANRVGTTVQSISRGAKVLGQDMVQDPTTGNWADMGAGLVKAGPNPFNTREFVLELTPAGIKLYQTFERILEGK